MNKWMNGGHSELGNGERALTFCKQIRFPRNHRSSSESRKYKHNSLQRDSRMRYKAMLPVGGSRSAFLLDPIHWNHPDGSHGQKDLSEANVFFSSLII